jgi:hypothetical protein
MVEVTKTGLLGELVWASRKGPENAKKTIHNGNQRTLREAQSR